MEQQEAQEAQEAQETQPENHLEDPMEKWHKEWAPPENYITLAHAKDICEEVGADFQQVIVQCQVIGQTLHTEKELPAGAFVEGSNWKVVMEENKVYHPQFQTLPFQAAVFRPDVEKACGLVKEEPAPAAPLATGEPTVDHVEVEGLPQGWDMLTCEGLVWQVRYNETGKHGPMRTTMARAVADAWSAQVDGNWS